MRNRILQIVAIASMAALLGCSNGNKSSTGSADRSAPQNPPNAEQGEPPGSHKGGNGPAEGAPAAGPNRPQDQSAGSNSAPGNPVGKSK